MNILTTTIVIQILLIAYGLFQVGKGEAIGGFAIVFINTALLLLNFYTLQL